ncbi:MAG: TraB/GumN family protein [Proteobacteria bacterium]|nr:TraB/GumN family protein [Pseudomonadota bacterium]
MSDNMHDTRCGTIRILLRPILLTILLAFAVPAPTLATDNTPNNKSALKNFGKGILWRIDAANTVPSYLFGTIHSDDPRVTKLPKPVEQAFNVSTQFVLEIAMSENDLLHMSQAMFLPQRESLQDILGIKLYDETRETLMARGMTDEHLHRLRPWLVITMLSMPPRRDGKFLDLNLHMAARQAKKTVHGLETTHEQIAVFDGLALKDQVELLRITVKRADKVGAETEQMIQAWLARDLRKLEALSRKNEADNPRLYRRIMRRLLHNRNARMHQRMQPILRQGGAFIAVGALHLGGYSGLLQQLHNDGYLIRPVY